MNSTELEPILPKLEWACRYNLTVKRYRHVERVIRQTRSLANRYGVDLLKSSVAAAGHDLAREFPPEELVSRADRYGVPRKDPLRQRAILLHGPVAAGIMEERYGVTDPEILDAVYHHTLGSPGLGDIGKLLYVSDYTEPGRPYLDDEERERLLGGALDDAVAAVIRHAEGRFGPVNDRTKAFYDALSTGRGIHR